MITNTAPASVLGAFSLNILQTFSDNAFVFKAGFKRYFYPVVSVLSDKSRI